jgi:hypothetical protein
MNFRKVDHCPLDIIKPYQRQKMSRAANLVNREGGSATAIGVGSGELLGVVFTFVSYISWPIRSETSRNLQVGIMVASHLEQPQQDQSPQLAPDCERQQVT